MRLRKLHELVPPWTDGKPFLFSYLALLALCLAISAYNYGGMLSLALSQVHVYGQPDVVDPGSRMTDFADLVGIQGPCPTSSPTRPCSPSCCSWGRRRRWRRSTASPSSGAAAATISCAASPTGGELARRAYALPLL